MKPSTMNFARRSRRATWRITSGFRYCSAVIAMRGVLVYLSVSERVGKGYYQAGEQGRRVRVLDAQDGLFVTFGRVPQDRQATAVTIDDDVLGDAEPVVIDTLEHVVAFP